MNIAAFLFSSAKFKTEQRSSITSKNYELHKKRAVSIISQFVVCTLAEMMSNFRVGSGVKRFAPKKGGPLKK